MRDNRIDILRFIGLSMIVFAHVDPPKLLFQLRNFDVPLMVLVSGMSFSLSYNSQTPYFAYIWKRIKRLVLPVWIFLTAYFVAQGFVLPGSPELNLKTIIGSYTLLGGIGYVWIIRVFLLVAFISPLLYKIDQALPNNVIFFISLLCFYAAYEGLQYVMFPYLNAHGNIGKLVSSILFYISAYAFIFSIGIRLLQIQKKQIGILIAISFSIFIFFAIAMYYHYGKVIPTQSFKYPPSIYYFSYALFASFFLWQNIEFIDKFLHLIKLKSTSLFISNNTIWIYLWHIPLVKLIHISFFTKYIVVFFLAVLITSFQLLVLNKWVLPKIQNVNLQKNLKIIFSG